MTALYRSETLRRAESIALAALPPLKLMRRAAHAVADVCATEARQRAPRLPIIALVGPGNNGGDAMLAASMLRQRGFDACAVLLEPGEPKAADARAAWAEARAAGLPILADLPPVGERADALYIDGLFGIGLSRPLSGRAASWIATLAAEGARVIAVDVPSGINADTGAIVGGHHAPAMRAMKTVAFIGDKPGLWTGAGIVHSGIVQVEALDVHILERDGTRVDAADATTLAQGLARTRDSHKGRHGHVAVLGGARSMRGAAMLAALGAQRAGAGKVSVGSPDGWHPSADTHPQLMSLAALAPLTRFDAVVAGCGLGRSRAAVEALSMLVHDCERQLVLDADALNLLAARPAWQRLLQHRNTPAVLTPHPLEAARLLQTDTGTIQADRIQAASVLASRTGSIVVLKGAGTVCADARGHWAIIGAGSPALATGGTGDVLAGVIGALLAQGIAPAAAACLGAWVHARAGERWTTRSHGEVGLSAADLPELIRQTINDRVAGCDH